MIPTIGVVIATPGRRSLVRTLHSIASQPLIEGDDVIVVGDGYDEATADIVREFGPQYRYVATEKTRDWGHTQVNYGLKNVRAQWVNIQDDDDIYLPRAFDEMRHIISRLEFPRPVVGRVMTPYRGILWMAPHRPPLDGHCLVVPNDKEKLGYYGLEYDGDGKWFASNFAAYDTVTWADRVWTLTRPTWTLWPRLVGSVPMLRWSWNFCRDDDGLPGASLATLDMFRTDIEGRWTAHLTPFECHRRTLTLEEACEVVSFAAWAGQGFDVWFDCAPDDEVLAQALALTGYAAHEVRADYLNFTIEWPPYKVVHDQGGL